MKITIIALATVLFLSCNSQKQDNEQDKTELAVQADSLDTKNTDTAITPKETHTEVIYKIILTNENNHINTKDINKLNEPLKALAALYAALGGTNCMNEEDATTCELTTALGLGKQGSDIHKNLIKKYFANDKLADAVIKQDCSLPPSGASFFTEYNYLTISDIGDTIKVDFKISAVNTREDDVKIKKGTDVYTFQANTFTKIKRSVSPEMDK
jgi:hypothetical protein